jgi:hypothetical protein
MKNKFTLALIIILGSTTISSGQYLNRQAGLRSGVTGGLFIQYSESSGNAETGLYGLLSFRENGLQVTGLRIFYETSLSEVSPDLYFTWGYGGHAGFVITNRLTFLGERYYFRGDRFCPLIGIDAWAGLEYRFTTIPLSLGLNIKPYIELTFPSFVSIVPVDLGISVAYTF